MAGRYNPLGGNAIIPFKQAPKKAAKRRVGSSALLESHGDPNGSAAAREAEEAFEELQRRRPGLNRGGASKFALVVAEAPEETTGPDPRRRNAIQPTAFELYCSNEGFDEEANGPQRLERPGASELEHWCHGRIFSMVATVRSRELALRHELGKKVEMVELECDVAAGQALTKMRDLRRLRDLAREEGPEAAEEMWYELLMQDDQSGAVGAVGGSSGFTYSRELLRVRQSLPKRGGAERVVSLLRALHKRASVEAEALEAPALLPGAIALTVDDPAQGKYMWLRQRPDRYDELLELATETVEDQRQERLDKMREKSQTAAIAPPIGGGGGGDAGGGGGGEGEQLRRRGRHVAVGTAQERSQHGAPARELHRRLLIEDGREQLAERRRWTQLLSETAHELRAWQARLEEVEGRRKMQEAEARALAAARAEAEAAGDAAALMLLSTMGGADGRGGGGGGNEQTRATREEAVAWADAIGAEGRLNGRSLERARGVAQEMAGAGYSRAATEAVLRALVHGSKGSLRAAWHIFVPAHADQQRLERATFRPVLRLLTGGMGLEQTEARQLFSLFDRDDSGAIDYDEFAQLLLAMPLAVPLEQTMLGATVSVLRSLTTLDSDTAGKLRGEQLAKAGNVILRLTQAGFSDEAAATVVRALFLSRSRGHLMEAWEVLQMALSHDLGGGVLRNILDAQAFARLLPLLGEHLSQAKIERLFEAVDVDGSGTLDFDEFVEVVRRLHPVQNARRTAAAQVAAFDSLCLAVKTTGGGGATNPLDVRAGHQAEGDRIARLKLRRAVEAPKRRFAGAVVCNMRDAGFDDAQVVQVLQVLFPARGQTSAEREEALQRAWHAFGGGDLVPIQQVAHDFTMTVAAAAAEAREGAGARAHEGEAEARRREEGRVRAALDAQFVAHGSEEHVQGRTHAERRAQSEAMAQARARTAVRFQASRMLLKAEFERLALLLLGDGIHHQQSDDVGGEGGEGGGGGEGGYGGKSDGEREGSMSQAQLRALFEETDKDNNGMIDFAEFCHLFAELTDGLKGIKGSRLTGGSVEDGTALASILDGAATLGAFDEVRMELVEAAAAGGGLEERAGIASKLVRRTCPGVTGLAGQLVGWGGEEVARLKAYLEEHADPLDALGKRARREVPPAHNPFARRVLGDMVAAGLSAQEAGAVLYAMYRARQPGQAPRRAVEAAWQVLARHAHRFAGGTQQLLKLVRKNDAHASDEALGADECQRMLAVAAGPLLPESQLRAIFAAFDANLDGEISVDELHRVLRMLNPHQRLKELAKLQPPPKPTWQQEALHHAKVATEPYFKKFEKTIGNVQAAIDEANQAVVTATGGGDAEGADGGGAEGGAEGEGNGGDTIQPGQNRAMARRGGLRRASKFLMAVGLDSGGPAADDDDDDDGGRGRRKKRNSTFEGNQKLAQKWKATAPGFAYG